MLSIPKTYFFPHEIPYNKKSGIQPLLLQLANFQKVPIALRHCLTTAVPIIYIYCITSVLPLQEKESRIELKKDDTFVSSFFQERETGLEQNPRPQTAKKGAFQYILSKCNQKCNQNAKGTFQRAS